MDRSCKRLPIHNSLPSPRSCWISSSLFSATITDTTARHNRNTEPKLISFTGLVHRHLTLALSNLGDRTNNQWLDKSYLLSQFGKVKYGQCALILTVCSIVSEALSSTKYMPHFPAGRNSCKKVPWYYHLYTAP